MDATEPGYRRRTVLAALGALASAGTGCLRLNAEQGTATAAPGETPTDETGRSSTPTETTDDGASGETETAETETGETESNLQTTGDGTVDQIFVDARNSMFQDGATVATEKPPIAWQRDVDVGYYSRIGQGPIVAEETVLVVDRQDVLVGVSRADGEVAWRFSDLAADDYRAARGTVTLRDGVAVTVLRNNRTRQWDLVGIDAASGEQQWTVAIPVDDGAEEHVTAFKGAGDLAYVGTTTRDEGGFSKLYAVDVDERAVAWDARIADGSLYPEDVAIADGVAYLTTDEAAEGMANVVAFDLDARERVWDATHAIGEGIPVVDDAHVYLPVNTDEGNDYIAALSRADGSIDWRFEQLNAPRTGVTVDDDYVYTVTDERLYALSPEDGSPQWSFATDGGPQLTGSSEGLPVATENLVLLGSWFGDEAQVRAVEKGTGDLAWSHTLPHGSITSPLVTGETLWTVGFGKSDDEGATLYALGGEEA